MAAYWLTSRDTHLHKTHIQAYIQYFISVHISHYMFPRYQLDLTAMTFTLLVSGVIYTAWHYSQLVYCSMQ